MAFPVFGSSKNFFFTVISNSVAAFVKLELLIKKNDESKTCAPTYVLILHVYSSTVHSGCNFSSSFCLSLIRYFSQVKKNEKKKRYNSNIYVSPLFYSLELIYLTFIKKRRFLKILCHRRKEFWQMNSFSAFYDW